jgi:2-polyprenyl-6-methoxyphenol hydroxylase-like FAD-dependent oxidoreductase
VGGGVARVATAVVGAGPAGLLFAAIGRLLLARRGLSPEVWHVVVFDKRERYERTHRLRLDPAPFREIAEDVEDPRFDAFVAFLEESDFAPEVNLLEDELLGLVRSLGVDKEKLAVGDGEGEVPLRELRARVGNTGGGDTPFSVIGADSVRSVVRDAVRGSVERVRRTHQHVARLRVVGADLPRRLGALDQFRLSKVLGSIVDYRLNRNGYAEVDLFLDAAEHAAVAGLGAIPREPVALTAVSLAKLQVPLFRAIVEHLERPGPSGQGRDVLLQSTFVLEHAFIPQVAFEAVGGTVFLVGDAAVSLPFFRGMACLARSAHSLARIHCDWIAGEERDPARRYDSEVAAIRRRELGIVQARAQLIASLREVVRVSALLPFPIQSWWLSAEDLDRREDRPSLWFWLAAATASASVALALGTPWAEELGYARLAPRWLPWTALLFAVGGGAAYHAALAWESGPHRYVRRVWQLAISAALVAGVALTISASWSAGHLTSWLASLAWLILGGGFLAGVYAFEWALAAWYARADLGVDQRDATSSRVTKR